MKLKTTKGHKITFIFWLLPGFIALQTYYYVKALKNISGYNFLLNLIVFNFVIFLFSLVVSRELAECLESLLTYSKETFLSEISELNTIFLDHLDDKGPLSAKLRSLFPLALFFSCIYAFFGNFHYNLIIKKYRKLVSAEPRPFWNPTAILFYKPLYHLTKGFRALHNVKLDPFDNVLYNHKDKRFLISLNSGTVFVGNVLNFSLYRNLDERDKKSVSFEMDMQGYRQKDHTVKFNQNFLDQKFEKTLPVRAIESIAVFNEDIFRQQIRENHIIIQ